jgi:pyridoxamine 5'-phosphate oxidase
MEIEEPLTLFGMWFEEATVREPGLPDAASLATATAEGRPSNRVVLVKRVSDLGFEFHTSYRSRKGEELAANPWAALTYHWKSLGRAVRVEGLVERLSSEESDEYWYSRPRESRISARASEQSRAVDSREELEAASAVEAEQIGEGEVPRPEHWGGYRLAPVRIEFWTHREDRFHERIEFRRESVDGEWERGLLQP